MPLLISKLPFDLICKTETSTTRPALLKSGYLCESCKKDEGLRVVKGRDRGQDQTVVLCDACRAGGGFEQVCSRRRAVR